MSDLRGFQPKIWVVVRPTGERHTIDKPFDDVREWAKGLDVTIAEYHLARVVHTPPPKGEDDGS